MARKKHRDSFWCEPCRSYHVDPVDQEEHAALKCFAPWEPKSLKITPDTVLDADVGDMSRETFMRTMSLLGASTDTMLGIRCETMDGVGSAFHEAMDWVAKAKQVREVKVAFVGFLKICLERLEAAK